ncbi:hypothetical protein NOM01_16895 [Sporolactobacillus sp. STSJ-5]|uniref:hypothetical protein n=1 Tax=Sporolactobacillus sp. STSJ-5 TaxID=2965076 RepID=UPI0021036845|nr:hypothetical protein [Sporolactobacillus sp. STSJ-5]MCQ2011661.1 hypothetical protein [Sporolactobacillus sp. STSJ-5]
MSDKYPKLYQTDYTELTIINYFLPLEKISSEAMVRELIVEPLIRMYEGKFEVVYTMVEKEIKPFEEVIIH